MFSRKYYLKVLIFLIAIPLVVMSYYLYQNDQLPAKAMLIGTIIFAVYGIPIDMYLTAKGSWSFGDDGLFGKRRLGGLPFEEYLFYVLVIPFIFVLFTLIVLFV